MQGDVLRILDANANRAREGLRVVEDYARFMLNDEGLCGELKCVRHELGEVLRPVLGDAILWRDTPGDVGTRIPTDGELGREDIADVVTAAGKRLGEALRTIEEYLKILDAAAAGKIERVRYRFYDLEQRVTRTLRPGLKFAGVLLYVLITESACRIPWEEAAKQAIGGGADCLQLREKELDGKELLARARRFVDMCRAGGVISIINDRPDIAILSGADGVHVGQEDLPALEVRKMVGTHKVVGVSTHHLAQAKQAVLDGADYVGVGPFFKSGTKPREFVAGGTFAREVAETIRIPAIAIAGITEENVGEVLATGIKAVAVTAAVVGCDDVKGAAERLKGKLSKSS